MLRMCMHHTNRVPLLPKLRGHFAEFLNKGSLARLRILSLPTCVGLRYGHQCSSLEAFLGSVGSVTSVLKFPSPSRLRLTRCGFACISPYSLGPAFPAAGLTYPPASPHPSNGDWWHRIFNRFSIAYALRLGLGPGLPWADEPSPGILRFSAGRILTCLFAYSYRHSHFCAVQCSLRYTFSPHRTLPYHCAFTQSVASVSDLSPGSFSAQGHSTSELLRTL